MTNSSANSVQSKLAATRAKQAEAQANPVAAQTKEAEAAKAKEDILYQQYKSSRPSTRIITDKGIRVSFVGFELLTNDPMVIEYLDAQIDIHGLPGISKGEILTLKDRDPMATMRRNLKEELRKELEEEAAAKIRGESRDMGATEGAGALNVLSTKGVAS